MAMEQVDWNTLFYILMSDSRVCERERVAVAVPSIIAGVSKLSDYKTNGHSFDLSSPTDLWQHSFLDLFID
jgi:hypothetical protein